MFTHSSLSPSASVTDPKINKGVKIVYSIILADFKIRKCHSEDSFGNKKSNVNHWFIGLWFKPKTSVSASASVSKPS